MNHKQPAVYILASDLIKRAWEHKNGITGGFTKKYNVHTLVYYQIFEDMSSAILREKQIKKWRRAWKIELIEKSNRTWRDLWPDILE